MRAYEEARAAYIAWCRAQLAAGPWEVPPGSNRNRYSKAVKRGAEAWCVDFAIAGLKATGSGGGIIDTASTLAHITWARSVGRYRAPMKPALGALAGVAKNGASVHTDACVIGASTSRLVAIGGNTSNRGGSTADGGGVYANDRTYMLARGPYRIYGYTVPFFGVSEDDAEAIQRALGVPVTRYITPATVAAVRRFQQGHGLKVDGFPGPATFSAITGQRVEQAATKPVTAATVERMRTDGILDVAAAGIIQGRLGTPRDGRIGPTDVKALQRFLGMRVVDGRLDGQNTYGRGKTPGIHPDAFRLGRGGSATVRALQAYAGLTGRDIDGLWGDQLNRQLAGMLGYPAFLTAADAGIADQRLRAAALR